MALDPYISPNQAVVKGGDVGADGENTTDAPSGKVVKGQLVPGGADSKKSAPAPAPAATSTKTAAAAPKAEAPNQSDTKDAWVDYAVSKGVSRDKAEAATKDQLIEKFGK